MSIHLNWLEDLKRNSGGYWGERIMAQLRFAVKMSEAAGGSHDGLLEDVIRFLHTQCEEEGGITRNAAMKAEEMMMELSPAAKKFQLICAAHAHIDMNWMWGYAETVAITLDTFRTMLNLMNEYPDFKFSQSQASVYRIVEEHDPAMLEEIKARVKEGRWEVTASTWVETDKNMPNGESLARHILYTKKFLSELLDLDPESLQLDFEPDTFGHSRNVPEILANGGVRYYYHCRGYEDHHVYRWKAPSGNSVLVYREPVWYNANIDADLALHIPQFCAKHGIDTMLKVYGVGDHGGGPTRRDVEKLIEMNTWPVFPSIRFGTFTEFFRTMEAISEKLPIVDRELNFVFTGCYTTQTRIKLANRIAEAKMNEAEAYSALSAAFAGGDYPAAAYEEAWKKVLFNHFHDILPGSGVIETREYAMGLFQQTLAAANTGISRDLRNIASRIDTSALAEDEKIGDTRSEGAGVGYALYDYGVPQTERGRGKNRILHFFNPSAHERQEPVEVTIWDWPGDKARLVIRDAEGRKAAHQDLEGCLQQYHLPGDYWGHKYMRLLVDVTVPAYGYSTYLLSECDMTGLPVEFPKDPRVEKADEYILENAFLRVEFDKKNASIRSMLDKSTGCELVNPERPAGIFRLIEEDDSKGMTSWIIGRYMNVVDLNRDVRIRQASCGKDALRQWITYSIGFRSSKLEVTVSLDQNSPRLNYQVECDWQETARKGSFIPQLNFHMPFAYKANVYKYDIPFGTIEREALDMDVPANSWAVTVPEEKAASSVMVVTNSKYGFRGTGDSISVTLIRSSYDPDPYPDNGIHKFKFAVDVVKAGEGNRALIERAYGYNHPISFVSGLKHAGKLPGSSSFLSMEGGSAAVSAIKLAEGDASGRRMIVRLYEVEGTRAQTVLKFAKEVEKAYTVDLNEKLCAGNSAAAASGSAVTVELASYSVVTVCIEFKR